MIVQNNDLSNKFALDTKGLGDLKQSAKAGSPEALKGAATQFEAMFINMMMKSMREATPQDELTGSEQTKMFTGMLDQQLSQNMAKRGVGLADMLIRQLSAQAANAPTQGMDMGMGMGSEQAMRAMPPARSASELMNARLLSPAAAPAVTFAASGRVQAPHVREFQHKLAGHADEAERATGIPAKFMLSQAALETGWGRREIRHSDGSSANNLFGIKAGPGWKGKVATAVTTEYVNGVPQTRVEKFRAYDSYADSFKDYAKLITNNPRYERVLANANAGDAAGFARGLQQAGYATDPLYAAKLSKIIKNNLA
jgi:flagellar protein FlgJ